MLKFGMCSEVYEAKVTRRSKGRRSKLQGQMKYMHKNMKYIPHTLWDSGNLPVLYEIEVGI